jgi:hypothetical protein
MISNLKDITSLFDQQKLLKENPNYALKQLQEFKKKIEFFHFSLRKLAYGFSVFFKILPKR